jgi:hypothetical protein
MTTLGKHSITRAGRLIGVVIIDAPSLRAISWRRIGKPAQTSGTSSRYGPALCFRLVSEPERRTEDVVVTTKWAAPIPPALQAEPEAQDREIAP